MPTIARGQINTPSILNWFTTVNGVLTDMFEVGFQVWDISGGLPGTQVFPAVPDTWETITDSDGHYSVGHYYAYDVAEDRGWKCPDGETLGTHRVKWRWKAMASSPYQSDAEDFTVLAESHGGTEDWYISLQDVRDAGLSIDDYPDADVIAAIQTWQPFLDRACRQWFNPRTLTLKVDGNDSDTLHFGVPIISIDYLKINDDDAVLDLTQYRVYNGNQVTDDRGNPCIKLVRSDQNRNIFTSSDHNGRLKFRKGRQNQEVKGTFGYVEPDGTTPKMISRALLKVVIEKLTNPVYAEGDGGVPPTLASIVSESTDGHSITYGNLAGDWKPRRPGLSGITQDQEVLDIIRLYRAPIGVATPAHWTSD